MDEDKKEKKSKSISDRAESLGRNAARVTKIIKWLKNPVIFYIALAILIIFLAIGVYGFFSSLPGGAAQWVADFFRLKSFSLKVSQEELYSLCLELESKGYDLETYGFVEKITRDKSNAENSKYEKGSIIKDSIKSKYLTAYIQSEKKSYIIANIDNFLDYIGENVYYRQITNVIAAEKLFDELWPYDSEFPISDDFKSMLFRMYEYKNGMYIVKNGIINDQDYVKYSPYGKIKEEDFRVKMREIISASMGMGVEQVEQKGVLEEAWDNFLIMLQNFGSALGICDPYVHDKSDEIARNGAKVYGDALLNCEYGKLFEKISTNYLESIRIENPESMPALIYIESDHVVTSSRWDGNAKWTEKIGGEEREYILTIDQENRLLKLSTALINKSVFNIVKHSGLPGEYAYDLNSWTCKYGKTTEFLIATHLATQAPDFAFEIATAPAIDTKVHIRIFPTNLELKFAVDEEGKNELSTLIEEINNNSDYVNEIKNKIQNEILNELMKDATDYTALSQVIKKYVELAHTLEQLYEILTTLNMPEPYSDTVKDILDYYFITTIDDTRFSLNDLYNENGIVKIMKKYEDIGSVGTPYITKVINHWYRNQYFIEKDEDFSQIKTRIRTMLSNIYAHIKDIDPEQLGGENEVLDSDAVIDITEYYSDLLSIIREEEFVTIYKDNGGTQEELDKINDLGDIDRLKDNEDIKKYLNIWNKIIPFISTDNPESSVLIENEIKAVYSQFENNISGSAYRVISNPRPIVYELHSEANLGDNKAVEDFFRKIYVVEKRDYDLVQIHNPTFEDNSLYVRNLLKDKYYIFGKDQVGTKNETTVTTEAVDERKQFEGKQYINGKAALAWINNMLGKYSVRPDTKYSIRDLQELFQDYEFELENVERPTEKVLANIMPDYISYTKWPSVYEQDESNCTKMIYKTSEKTKLAAPEKCEIRRTSNQIVEIDIPNKTNPEYILYIEAVKGTIEVEEQYALNAGDTIGTIYPDTGMIILKLRLFNATKQILKLEDYMNVKKYNFSSEPKLPDEQKRYLYDVQEKLVEKEYEVLLFEEERSMMQRISLINTIFNKVASPNYPQSATPKDAILYDTDFIDYKESGKTLKELENNINHNAQAAIVIALDGTDYTKSSTMLGATRYFDVNSDMYKYTKNLRASMQIYNRVFAITEEEYSGYIKTLIDKKLNEVLYVLFKSHNIEGINAEETKVNQKFMEFIESFSNAKKQIIDEYYDPNNTLLKYCSATTNFPDNFSINSMIKSNIKPGEIDESGKVKDEFTITVNSNYIVKWFFEYTIEENGIIKSEITVTNQAIKNY